MEATLSMDNRQQAEQQAIEAYLQQCGHWYARLRKISTKVISFPTWDEEEQAGNEAFEKWDEALCGLERYGIYDEDIRYDEATETATIIPDE